MEVERTAVQNQLKKGSAYGIVQTSERQTDETESVG